MQPAYPPAAPEPTSPDLAAKLKSLKPEKVLPWLVGGLFVFIVAAALVAEAVNSPSDTFTMEGSLTLYDSTTRSYGYGEEFDCEGDGGYSDIYPGRDILVYGVDESLIAKGEFVSSDKTGSTCSMHFAVEDVPRGEQFYQLEISDRGRMTYSEDEAQESIGLSLGD
ncbi:hypothetical protein BFN03_10830 [Rhodococcus sp. WMMA185]|nr:hypothetical protein BFN03_10830 [Rhodococcus sp. WMMA185]